MPRVITDIKFSVDDSEIRGEVIFHDKSRCFFSGKVNFEDPEKSEISLIEPCVIPREISREEVLEEILQSVYDFVRYWTGA